MKKLIAIAIFTFLALGSARVFADEDWNIQIKTDDGPPTIPFDSTGFLSLDNFSVSALASISDLTYNATVSELSFRVELTAEEFARTQGTNVNITLPRVKCSLTFSEKTFSKFILRRLCLLHPNRLD